MCSLPFNSKSYHHIMSIAAFHHLSNPERRRNALLDMKRITKDNGTLLLSVWSKNQPDKMKVKFNNYGHVYVPWKKGTETYYRYYYIFELQELYELFIETGWKVLQHRWDCGNEVFVLKKLL